MGSERQLSCGRMVGCIEDIREASANAAEDGFDFIGSCICHPRCMLDPSSLPDSLPDITRADLELTSNEWTRCIIGEVSPWIDCDSDNPRLRNISEKELNEELTYANYLSLTVFVIPLKSSKCINLARVINAFLQKSPYTSVWIKIPACLMVENPHENGGESSDSGDSSPKQVAASPLNPQNDPWEWWNTVRTLCDNSKRLGLILEVTADLPESRLALRWTGEPVKCISLNTSLFLTNSHGNPVLSRAHQRFIHAFYKLEVQVVLTGAPLHANKSITAYKEYMEWIWHQMPSPDSYETFAKGYEDYLQVPLQPLSDHLESTVYETFERDPVKYSEYERAIQLALADKKSENSEDFVVTVMVLGAGRGPLVRATVRAAMRIRCKIKLYAVEKNPSAVITLKHLAKTEWTEQDVEIIHADMRLWKPEQKADVIVSELLGSFGDNELSPECLDGAAALIKGDAVSIPQSYTSYVCPVQSEKLYRQIKDFIDKSSKREDAFDTGYVVRVHNRFQIDEPKPLFTFDHPNFDGKANTRESLVKFDVQENSLMHGIVGFFEATLYKEVKISTVPATHSPGMFSWFPILFPFREPVYCRKGDTINLHFWRLKDEEKAWYEWCLSSPTPTPLQNPNGETYKMKLF